MYPLLSVIMICNDMSRVESVSGSAGIGGLRRG